MQQTNHIAQLPGCALVHLESGACRQFQHQLEVMFLWSQGALPAYHSLALHGMA